MSRGYLIFANNNPQVDYGLLALINALMIKANCRENNVSLVTDEGTIGWLRQSRGALVDQTFDQVIVRPWDEMSNGNERRFNDTLSTTHTLPWYNALRPSAYTLTPYEETILIDSDYLVADRSLDATWGSQDEIMINRDAVTLEHKLPPTGECWLDPFTIPMSWATCVYFRKGERAKLLFDLVSHVRENYEFYRYVYGFKGKLYRNDFTFSIAIHMLNGFGSRETIPSLPVPKLLTSFDCDELIEVPARNEFLFLVNDTSERWRFRATRVTGMNVHVMNKFSIIRHADRFIELYGSAA